MSGIFSGLSKLGLYGIEGIEIFEKDEKNDFLEENARREQKKADKKKVIIDEMDTIYDKTYICPVCDIEFKSKTVMTGKAKLVSIDTDLRPRYQEVDCIKYDCVTCDNCGYSVLTRYFGSLSSSQIKSIKDNICDNFQGVEFGKNIYSYDDAITRYQLALANSIVKHAKNSERAYACLKLAWLYRGKAEHLDETEIDYAAWFEECKNEEKKYLANAYEGFKNAMQNEYFPICGMDEPTLTYLIADLARRNKDYETSAKLISQIIISKNAPTKVKERARDLKEIIRNEVKEGKSME